MFFLPRPTLQPIGIDVGSDGVKMLQLRAAEDGGGAVAARYPLPAAAGAEATREAVTSAVRRALRHGPFDGRRVVAALPRDALHLRNLRLAPIPTAELAWAVAAEARDLLPFEPDAANVQFIDAGEVRPAGGIAGSGGPSAAGAEARREVILMAAAGQDVDDFLLALEQGGASVLSLDAGPCAAYRAVRHAAAAGGDGVNVVVDVGSSRTHVVIGKADRVRLIRSVDVGGRHFQQAVSRKLGVTADEARLLRRRLAQAAAAAGSAAGAAASGEPRRDPVARAVHDAARQAMETLAREVDLCLRYDAVTFRGPRPARVSVVGGEAGDPQLLAVLNATLGVRAEPARLLENVDVGGIKPADHSATWGEWAVALGLALRWAARPQSPRTTGGAPAHPAEAVHGNA